MRNYSPEEKEFILRPIIWLVFHAMLIIVWLIISFAVTFLMKSFTASLILRASLGIILATGFIALLLRTLNFYFEDRHSKNNQTTDRNTIEFNRQKTKA